MVYRVRVINNPSVKPKSVAIEVAIFQAIASEKAVACIGTAQVFLALDSASKSVKYGDELLIANRLKKIEEPANPHQFNFKKYYQTKNIFHNGFLPQGSWQPTFTNKGNPLLKLGYFVQSNLQKQFKQYIKDENSRGIAQAIVFGYKEELDDESMRAFSKTGTIHVLAVSGLHVGIIIVLLSFALNLKNSKTRSLAIKSTVILVFLFLYCLITGFSPSVCRAAIMFGLVLVGKIFLRKASIYNTLSFACLILLIANPNNLFNVGFQFSFLAVLGIVFFEEDIRKLVSTSNGFADKVIRLSSVSVAAQITTFPLGLYYFHQFPNQFLLSNLIVIPYISIILHGGIFFVGFSYFHSAIASFLAKGVSFYIAFISDVVSYIQAIPYSTFENVYISFWQMLLMYVFLFSLPFVWQNRWKAGLWIPLMCAVVYLGCEISNFRQIQKTEVLCFYHPTETLIMFRKNDAALFLASSGIYKDNDAMKYIVTPYLVNEGITQKFEILPIESIKRPLRNSLISGFGNGTVWFNGQSYILLDATNAYISKSVETDNLIIGRKKSSNYLKTIGPLVDAKKVILAPNMPKYLETELKLKKYFKSKTHTYISSDYRYIEL